MDKIQFYSKNIKSHASSFIKTTDNSFIKKKLENNLTLKLNPYEFKFSKKENLLKENNSEIDSIMYLNNNQNAIFSNKIGLESENLMKKTNSNFLIDFPVNEIPNEFERQNNFEVQIDRPQRKEEKKNSKNFIDVCDHQIWLIQIQRKNF